MFSRSPPLRAVAASWVSLVPLLSDQGTSHSCFCFGKIFVLTQSLLGFDPSLELRVYGYCVLRTIRVWLPCSEFHTCMGFKKNVHQIVESLFVLYLICFNIRSTFICSYHISKGRFFVAVMQLNNQLCTLLNTTSLFKVSSLS